jgi:NAD(P)-dependent dehydrogenase (short-subunit alcohol dehydrogenase family)
MQRNALVIGASGGIGHALAAALRSRGDHVTCLSRAQDGFDITCEETVAKRLAALNSSFDLIVVATGILAGGSGPEKSLKTVSAAEMAHLFAVNAIGPALVLKHVQRLFPKDRRAVFAALSARVGSIGDNALGGWYSYRASKAALNQLIKTASVELQRSHPQLICASLHPGTVDSAFTQDYPQHKKVPALQAAGNLLAVIDGLTPSETGGFYDWAGEDVPW